MAARLRRPNRMEMLTAAVLRELDAAKEMTVEQLDARIEFTRVQTVIFDTEVDHEVLAELRRYRSTLV